jgi:4-hydroxy-2-oxoheptanedioate aldolase
MTFTGRRLPSAGVAKTILHGASGCSTKFSWVLVDAEHGLISDHHYYEVCLHLAQLYFAALHFPSLLFYGDTDQTKLNNAIGSEGASPIIRVPYAEEWMIKRALDAGAHGIMTPMCHSEVSLTN